MSAITAVTVFICPASGPTARWASYWNALPRRLLCRPGANLPLALSAADARQYHTSDGGAEHTRPTMDRTSSTCFALYRRLSRLFFVDLFTSTTPLADPMQKRFGRTSSGLHLRYVVARLDTDPADRSTGREPLPGRGDFRIIMGPTIARPDGHVRTANFLELRGLLHQHVYGPHPLAAGSSPHPTPYRLPLNGRLGQRWLRLLETSYLQ